MSEAPTLSTVELAERLVALEDRVEELERKVTEQARTITSQAATLDTVTDGTCCPTESAGQEPGEESVTAAPTTNEQVDTERLDALEARVTTCEDHLSETDEAVADLEAETERLDGLATAGLNKAGANTERIQELQARELEKGAHLDAEQVAIANLPIEGGRLEKVTKEAGTYYRLPDAEDPLDRGGSVTLAHRDLLPIQQLARMDEEMLHSTTNALPDRLAANLWQARVDPAVGDSPWREGSRNVTAYVKASDLRHWIRRQETGISKEYAQKLVTRTLDAIRELSKYRLCTKTHRERKNGLSYEERRLILPADAEIPGETIGGGSPTAGVAG